MGGEAEQARCWADAEEAEVARAAGSRPDILLVGMSSPKTPIQGLAANTIDRGRQESV